MDPAGLHEVQAKPREPVQQAMQSRLAEFASDDRVRAASRDVEPGERNRRRLIELARDADLVGRGHKIFLRIPPRLCVSSWQAKSPGASLAAGEGHLTGPRPGQMSSRSRARSNASRRRL